MPIIKLHNINTNQIEEREMNDAELAIYEASQAATEKERADKEKAFATKSALLEKLGITADEAKLLLS